MKISTCRPPRKWLSSLREGTAVACLVLAAVPSAFAQHLSIGIKAGIPLTDVVQAESTVLSFQAETKHYTIGPVVDIGLPRRFGVEVGAMYKRFDQRSTTITTTGFITSGDETFPIQEFRSVSAAGTSWEFPVAVQYHLSLPVIRPYVEAGVSFNHLSNVFSFENFPFTGPRTLPFTLAPTSSSFNRAGVLFGAGVEINLHVIHVTPGLRYTHYNETRPWLPATNAADFLVGFTF